MNAIIYARFSSYAQNEQSIEGQLKECYEYAKREGYTVIAEYIDRALSGKTDNRPKFQKMITDSAKRQFEVVLVYQLENLYVISIVFDKNNYRRHFHGKSG